MLMTVRPGGTEKKRSPAWHAMHDEFLEYPPEASLPAPEFSGAGPGLDKQARKRNTHADFFARGETEQ